MTADALWESLHDATLESFDLHWKSGDARLRPSIFTTPARSHAFGALLIDCLVATVMRARSVCEAVTSNGGFEPGARFESTKMRIASRAETERNASPSSRQREANLRGARTDPRWA